MWQQNADAESPLDAAVAAREKEKSRKRWESAPPLAKFDQVAFADVMFLSFSLLTVRFYPFASRFSVISAFDQQNFFAVKCNSGSPLVAFPWFQELSCVRGGPRAFGSLRGEEEGRAGKTGAARAGEASWDLVYGRAISLSRSPNSGGVHSAFEGEQRQTSLRTRRRCPAATREKEETRRRHPGFFWRPNKFPSTGCELLLEELELPQRSRMYRSAC